MTATGAQTDPLIIEQRWEITYTHTADAVTTRFLTTLRDEGKLLGVRCPVCKRVLAPPRPFCDRDFCEVGEFVELPLTGTLELFTIMHVRIEGLLDPPYVLAYVKPDGADTAMGGYLEGVDLSTTEGALERLKIGAPVSIELRPKEERTARMTDLFFRLKG